MGERLALEAMHSLADRPAWPRRLVSRADASLVPMINFRFEDAPDDAPALAAAEERLTFPLLPVPSLPEARVLAADYAAAAQEAEARGAGPAEHLGLVYHAKWAKRLVEDLEAGGAVAAAEGPVNAVRIGDGVIVSGPGEVFTEIGLAVRERSPGQPTLYSGYTNGAVSYFATSEAFGEGGYEPAFSNRTYGLPAPLAPGCDRLLVEHGVRLAESLFPECVPFSGSDWSATADHFGLPSRATRSTGGRRWRAAGARHRPRGRHLQPASGGPSMRPPSTEMIAPVTQPASGATRCLIQRATSSGCPTRPSGTCCPSSARRSGESPEALA